MIAELAARVFSHLCHQEAGRAWVVGGRTLVLCARCTGVYAGLALAWLTVPLARKKPTTTILWLHGAAMLQMVVFGFHMLEPQPHWVRTLSGSLFAAGAVYFLHLPARARIAPEGGGSPTMYLVAAGAMQLVLQVVLRADARWMGTAVEGLALGGIAATALLVLFWVMAAAARRHRDRARA